MDLTLEEGQFLVEYARKEIEAHFLGGKPDIPESMKNLMSKKLPVFVKLNNYPKRTLRGSAGYTEKILPLGTSLKEMALAAALTDPRFHPLRKSELKSITVEVSILSEPQLIKVDDTMKYPEQIVIGRDGLLIEKDKKKGFMLPQIAVELMCNPRSFLSFASMNAGLSPDAWRDPQVKVYRFNAQIFAEEEPNGKIIERKLC